MNDKEREVMQQALDALTPYKTTALRIYTKVDAAIDALRQALAAPDDAITGEGGKPAQEPVAWRVSCDKKQSWTIHSQNPIAYTNGTSAILEPLYTMPQPAPDLTERLKTLSDQVEYWSRKYTELRESKPALAVSDPVPAGFVLVQTETLLNWKSMANETAARTSKAERHQEGAALKQSIADVLAAAPKPPAHDTEAAVIESAQANSHANCAAAWLLPIPGILPEQVVLCGEREQCLRLLAAAPKSPAAPFSEPVTNNEIAAACNAANLRVTRESVKDVRNMLEGFVAGRAKGAAQ